jgi:tetratricopeptide (TPR) repeat protein
MREALQRNPEQFKALAFLGEFLYYQGKLNEAETVLQRSVELGRGTGEEAPSMMAAFLYASRSQRDKIDPEILRSRPENVIDGDVAYWMGGIYALLGERAPALAWLRRAVELGNHNYPWFQKDKNYDTIRSDPEYQKILDGVRQHWEEYKLDFGMA